MAIKIKNKTKMVVRPLRDKADYDAVLERIEELAENGEEESEGEELELLESLVEDYEAGEYNDSEEEYLEDSDDYELVSELPESETLSLANFNLSNGNVLRFVGIPELGEIMMGEIADVGFENFVIDSEVDPVRLFHRLAPKNVGVPRMLSRLDKVGLFEGRKIIDSLDRSIEVPVKKLGVDFPTTKAVAGSGSCQIGTAGAQYFENHHCNTSGGPGYGKSESYCFSGSYLWVQKTSSSRRRATYTRMASCGNGMNRMQHLYKTSSGYHTQVNIFVDPQKVIHWWSAKKGIRRWRRVRLEKHEEGGWVRGWIKYHSQVADGWY